MKTYQVGDCIVVDIPDNPMLHYKAGTIKTLDGRKATIRLDDGGILELDISQIDKD